jgi:hypothetical protein
MPIEREGNRVALLDTTFKKGDSQCASSEAGVIRKVFRQMERPDTVGSTSGKAVDGRASVETLPMRLAAPAVVRAQTASNGAGRAERKKGGKLCKAKLLYGSSPIRNWIGLLGASARPTKHKTQMT